MLSRLLPRPAWLGPLALGIFAVAGFHLFEHVLQTYQAYVLRAEHAHGLLGQYFESDWIHFAFNGSLFLALLPIARQGGVPTDLRWQFFAGGVVAQGLHAVEHSIKLYQSALLGHDPAFGVAGQFGPLIPIHLWLNAVCYVLVAPHLWRLAMGWWRERRTMTLGGPAPSRAP